MRRARYPARRPANRVHPSSAVSSDLNISVGEVGLAVDPDDVDYSDDGDTNFGDADPNFRDEDAGAFGGGDDVELVDFGGGNALANPDARRVAEEEERVAQRLRAMHRQLDVLDPKKSEQLVDELIEGGGPSNPTNATNAAADEHSDNPSDTEAMFFTRTEIRDAESQRREGEMVARLHKAQEALKAVRGERDKTARLAKRLGEERDQALEQLELERSRTKAPDNLPLSLSAATSNEAEALMMKKKKAQEDARRRRRRRLLQSGQWEEDEDDDEEMEDDSGRRDVRSRISQFGRRFERKLERLLYRLNFLGRDTAYIEARFGGGIAAYFHFWAWMVLMSFVFAVPILAMFVVHCIEYFRLFPGTIEYGNYVLLPEVMLYESFTSDETGLYAALVLVQIVFLSTMMYRKVLKEDRLKRERESEERDAAALKYSRIALNCWDHSVLDPQQNEDSRYTLVEKFRIIVEEDKIGKVQSERTRRQRYLLYAKRTGGMLAYLIVVLATYIAVVYIRVIEDQIESTSETYGSFIVNAVVALISAVQSPAVLLITSFEKWDRASFSLKVGVVRLYFLRMSTVIIYFVTYYYCELFGEPYWSSVVDFFGGGSDAAGCLFLPASSLPRPPEDGCVENFIGSEIFQFLATTVVIDMLLEFMKIFFHRTVKPRLLNSNVKPEYGVFKKVIGVIYKQSLVWLTYPFAPFSALYCSLLLLINFKVEKRNLISSFRKPTRAFSAHDTGVFFMFFYSITFLAVLGGYGIVYDQYENTVLPPSSDTTWRYDSSVGEPFTTLNIRHCGPFNDTSFISFMKTDWFESSSLLEFFWTALNAPLVIWTVVAILTLSYKRTQAGFSSMVLRVDAISDRYRDEFQRSEAVKTQLLKKNQQLRRQIKTMQRTFEEDFNDDGIENDADVQSPRTQRSVRTGSRKSSRTSIRGGEK